MEFGLKGKVALVAGASKGFGRATAMALANEGSNLVICARRLEPLQQLAGEIQRVHGVAVEACRADVSVAADIDRVVERALSRFGRVDILVTNSGGPAPGSFLEVSWDDWQKGIDNTLMSMLRFCRAVVPVMQRNQWGRIINITSIAVKQPIDGLIISNALRPAVVGIAKSLANEFAKYNITVNNVAPGYHRTERVDELLQVQSVKEKISPAEAAARIESSIPMGRMGQPEECAALIVFLASEAASYITGTTISIDGGAYRGVL